MPDDAEIRNTGRGRKREVGSGGRGEVDTISRYQHHYREEDEEEEKRGGGEVGGGICDKEENERETEKKKIEMKLGLQLKKEN